MVITLPFTAISIFCGGSLSSIVSSKRISVSSAFSISSPVVIMRIVSSGCSSVLVLESSEIRIGMPLIAPIVPPYSPCGDILI